MPNDIQFTQPTKSFTGRKEIATVGIRIVTGLDGAQLQPLTSTGKCAQHLMVGIPGTEEDAAALCRGIMNAAAAITKQREQRAALSALRSGLAYCRRETLLVAAVIVGECFHCATSEGLALLDTLAQTPEHDTHRLWLFLEALPRAGIQRLTDGLSDLTHPI